MTTRTIKKNLAGEDDLLYGEGTVIQTRNDAAYNITKVRTIRPVNSLVELNALDTDKFVKAALFENNQVTMYSYSLGSGLWEVAAPVVTSDKVTHLFDATSYQLDSYLNSSAFVYADLYATFDGVTDDTVALTACHVYAAANSKKVIYPSYKTALVSPIIGTNDESTLNTGTDVKVCFDILDNLDIDFNGCTLKMADNVSSNGTPVQMRMFFSNTPKENVTFRCGYLDMNGANNLVNSQLFTQFHFGFSGTNGGIAASGSHITLSRMRFLNTAGKTCIAGGQTNTTGLPLGTNWLIEDCEFRNNGLDTPDHSTIFAWFTDSEIINNTFDNPLPFNVATSIGGLVACELHGSRLLFSGNTINNYYQGLWLASNNAEVSTYGMVVTNNRARVSKTFFDVYSRNVGSAPETVADSFVYNAVVANNFITLTDDTVDEAVRGVFQISAARGVRGIKIHNNSAVVLGTVADTVMLRVTVPANVYEPHDQIECYDNQCTGGLVGGVTVYWNASSTIPRMAVKNNDFGYYVVGAVLPSVDLNLFGGASGDIDSLTTEFLSTTSVNVQTDNPTHGTRCKLRGRAYLNVAPTLFNITEGNGTKISRVFADTTAGVVNMTTHFTLGSTSTIDGAVSIGLPSIVSSTAGNIATATALRGTTFYPLIGNNDVTGAYFSLNDSGGAVDATNPLTFTTGDAIKLTGQLYADYLTL